MLFLNLPQTLRRNSSNPLKPNPSNPKPRFLDCIEPDPFTTYGYIVTELNKYHLAYVHMVRANQMAGRQQASVLEPHVHTFCSADPQLHHSTLKPLP